MSQVSLRSLTLETVANYSRAAELAIDAYRAGSHRLIAAMQRGVDQVASRSAEVIVPRMVAAVRRASEQVGDFAGKGVDAFSTRTERAIEASTAGVTAQVERVADLADAIDNRALATGLQTAVRFSLPGAQVALKVSERVAANADKVHGTVAAESKPVKAVRRAAKPVGAVKKQAKKAVATAKRGARKAAAAPAKVARRAAKTVEAAVDAAA